VIQELLVRERADVWSRVELTELAKVTISAQRVPGGGGHVWVNVSAINPEFASGTVDDFLSPDNETDLSIEVESRSEESRPVPFEVERLPAKRRLPASRALAHFFVEREDIDAISLRSEKLKLG
jgi:hypothetical protein